MTMTPTVLATRDNGVMDQHHDEQDPAAKPRRRTFTAEKKLALLAEYDAADREGREHYRQRGERWRNEYGLVFVWDDGRHLNPDWIWHEFVRLPDSAGLPRVRFHDPRHTHATLLLRPAATKGPETSRTGPEGPVLVGAPPRT